MINLKYTRTFETANSPVLSAHLIEEEGFAMIYVKEGNETVVRKSQGAANEIFAGFSLARNAPTSRMPLVIEGEVIDQAAGYDLPRLPITGQLRVEIDGAAATIGAGVPGAAGAVQLAADHLAFHADDDGKSLSIWMMFEPTVNEARMLTGDMPVGGLAGNELSHCGLFVRGDICTNLFDAAIDWSAVANPTLGADGILTSGGAGVVLSNVVVIHAPDTNNAFLVLRVK